ncbi:hypothetical protein HAX54_017327, partial [Datura stramonium]|nr:hypothetical protein [Datura stramonium]
QSHFRCLLGLAHSGYRVKLTVVQRLLPHFTTKAGTSAAYPAVSLRWESTAAVIPQTSSYPKIHSVILDLFLASLSNASQILCYAFNHPPYDVGRYDYCVYIEY